ncbi:hypothetical protein M2139_000629 [Enterococcus sp. PF1-24]|uniref:DUF916 and DUF3324 domain-containing protein n=1 Tax=unclassified Enterococcus TaxID=2608891 RepID=UPI0024734FB6|nr:MULTISPECIES: DUF916 and DUF3324 domain-containing protein [unclassified Enterococcus]MDH6363792.1 hypothetical protein [Enterococcus sp. PFB1-1]MDH6400748.1 hypothetical protein [Enterococcus sp. PF1-24]
MKAKNCLKMLISLLFLGISFLFNNGGVALAAMEDGGAAGFTYNVNFPENHEGEVGYYNLRMTPGQKQTVSISLHNPTDKAIVMDIALNGAKTNQNGVIEYGETEIANDASLKYDFKDIVTGPSAVEIPAGESRELALDIQMPTTAYEGIIVGGIRMQKQEDPEADKQVNGSMINNKFAYVVAMVLKESDAVTTPEVKLNQVYAGSANYRNAFFVNYSNVQADFLNNVATEVEISKKGNETITYTAKKTQMRMAPNTQMDFPVNLNGEKMQPGKYSAHVVVISNENRWEWTEEFEVTQEQAAAFNERDVDLVQEKGVNWQLIALIVGGVVFLFIIGLLVLKTSKKNKK